MALRDKTTQPQAVRDLITKRMNVQKALETRRANWENMWQDVMDHVVPRKNDILDIRAPGERRETEPYDSTAINANERLAGFLHAVLTNPTVRFFDLIMGDEELDNDEDVKEWLQDTAERMMVILHNSNFQTEVHETYIDLGSVGTAPMYIGEHPDKVVHFSARPIQEVYIDENNLEIVDVVHRKYKWTPRQIVQEFGAEKCPTDIVTAYEKGDDARRTVLHCVYPMEEDAPEIRRKVFPFRSLYILVDEEYMVRDKGFREFPFAVPRWSKTSNEVYGRGPGCQQLPNILMIDAMMETTLKAGQLAAAPPFAVDDQSIIGRMEVTPFGLTVKRRGTKIEQLIDNPRVDYGFQMISAIKQDIRAGFYVDQFSLPHSEGTPATREEIIRRTEEQMQAMGPVIGRQNNEFLRPVIDRVYNIGARMGKFKPPPEKIRGMAFDVKYSSLVARAQRMSEGNSLLSALALAEPVVKAKPEVLDIVDGDAYLRHVMDIHGVTHKILRKSGVVQKIREDRAAAEQQMKQMAMMGQAAQAAGQALPGIAAMQGQGG